MPPQRFFTFPSTGQVGVEQTVTYDTADARLPVEVTVTFNPDKGGFSVDIGDPNIQITPPAGCTSVTFEDQTGQSQAFTLPVQ